MVLTIKFSNMDTIIVSVVIMILVGMCLRWDNEPTDRWLLYISFLANLLLVCMHVYTDGSHLYYEMGSNYLPW